MKSKTHGQRAVSLQRLVRVDQEVPELHLDSDAGQTLWQPLCERERVRTQQTAGQ